jgi:hypothetical protein
MSSLLSGLEGLAKTAGRDIKKGVGTVGRVVRDGEKVGKAFVRNIYKVPSFKKGGKVKKTGLAYVHKGEKVIPKNKVKKVKKALKKYRGK